MNTKDSIVSLLKQIEEAKQQAEQSRIEDLVNKQYLEQNALRMTSLNEMRTRTRDRLKEKEKGKGGIVSGNTDNDKLTPKPSYNEPAKPKPPPPTPIYKVAKNWSDYDKLQNEEAYNARKAGRKPNYSLIKRPGFVPPISKDYKVSYAGTIPNVLKNPDYDEFYAGRKLDTEEEYEKNKNILYQGKFKSYAEYKSVYENKSKPFIYNPVYNKAYLLNKPIMKSKIETISPLGKLKSSIKKINNFPVGIEDKSLSNVPGWTM